MKRLSNEVKIGITFIIAIVLLYFGINFLKGRSTLAKESTYYVVYNQISGLTPSAIINNNGYCQHKSKERKSINREAQQ